MGLLVVAELTLEGSLGHGGESPAGLAGHAVDDPKVAAVGAPATLHGGVNATDGGLGLFVGSQRYHLFRENRMGGRAGRVAASLPLAGDVPYPP